MAPRLLGVGDNCLDIYVEEGVRYPGGNAVNVAVMAARQGVPSSYAGRVGDDSGGRLMLDSLAAEGVDASRCQQVPGVTAWAKVSHRGGDRIFLGSDHGVTAEFRLADVDTAFIRAHDVVHTSTYSHLEPDLPELRTLSRRLTFDFSEEWRTRGFGAALDLVDAAFLSYPGADDEAVTQLLATLLRRDKAPEIVVTRGKRPAAAAVDGRILWQPIVETPVVDTLGAGDGFIAGYLVGRLGGGSAEAALAAAARYAAFVCTYWGGFGHGQPTEGRSS